MHGADQGPQSQPPKPMGKPTQIYKPKVLSVQPSAPANDGDLQAPIPPIDTSPSNLPMLHAIGGDTQSSPTDPSPSNPIIAQEIGSQPVVIQESHFSGANEQPSVSLPPQNNPPTQNNPQNNPPSQPINIDGGGVLTMQQLRHIPSPKPQQIPQSRITVTVQDKSQVDSLAMVTSSNLNAQSDSAAPRAVMPLQDVVSSPLTQQVNEATQLISLNPYALAFHLPSSASASASTERNSAMQPLQKHFIADTTLGYLDNVSYGDSFESDKIVDDDEDEGWSSAFDIMDGSEGSIRQKRRDRRKSKGQTKTSSVTKEELKDQSRILGKAIKKRGRPPGSRNRTYFDVVRTMTTRNKKSTSD